VLGPNVLASAGGCFPVDRHASLWVWSGGRTAAPSTSGGRLMGGPGRVECPRVRCPLRGPACRRLIATPRGPSADATARLMPRQPDRSRCCKRFHPVLGGPLAVRPRPTPITRNTAAGRHGCERLRNFRVGDPATWRRKTFPSHAAGPGSRVRGVGRRRNRSPPHAPLPVGLGRGQ